MWVGTCLLTILFLAIAIYQKAKVLYQKMPEDHDHLPCVSNQSEHDNCFRASQVDKDYIRMFIKEEKRKRALFQLWLTPHSTDISLISSGPGFFLLFSIFFLHTDQDYKKDLKSVCTCYSFIGSRLLHCKFPGLSRVM